MSNGVKYLPFTSCHLSMLKSPVRPQQEETCIKLPIHCAVAGFLILFIPEHPSRLWLNDSWRKAVPFLSFLQMFNIINIVKFSWIVSLVLFNLVDSCRQQQRCERKLEQNQTDLLGTAPHLLGFDSISPPQTIHCILYVAGKEWHKSSFRISG